MSEFVFCTGRYASGDWESAPLLPANLIDSVARYTSIEVAATGVTVPLDSPRIFDHPLVYLTGHLPFRLNEAERANMRLFTERGGMVFIDDHNHDVGGIFHKTATEEIGRTWSPLRALRNDHRLYSAFFEFKEGPPATSHELNGWGDNLIHPHLSAVTKDGRISVLYSNKDYSSEWNYHPENKKFSSVDNTRFGVNIIVYALTS
ncbi:MAG TPA: DUF4159 domain-containing protein [Gemmatimonadaceae bacterium]|nr:DUF4159 domain-containing protein [Gemmatimonadaceae bacterium]